MRFNPYKHRKTALYAEALRLAVTGKRITFYLGPYAANGALANIRGYTDDHTGG